MTGDTTALRAAGSAALVHNAPLGAARAATLVAALAEDGPTVAADLGCGRGSLLLDLLAAAPGCAGVGIDLDEGALADGRDAAQVRGLADRVRFVEGDLSTPEGRAPAAGADRLIAVAVSHAVGGAEGLLQVLDDLLVPDGLALVGDGVWLEEPDDWCRGVFGDLPSPEGLVQLAAHTGFEVADVDRSTTQEWDEFEGTWTDAVEAVGTPEARDFAASRREEYQRYRGVLGFTWLLLRRP